jgi:arylformamidase
VRLGDRVPVSAGDDLAARIPRPATREALERAYSPSSCIGGDYRPFVTAYRVRSDAARADAIAAGGRWQRLRIGDAPLPALELCLPGPGPGSGPGPTAADAPEAGHPLLVFVHGGYWQELAAADSLFAAAACVRAGIAFAALDYALAPAATVEDIVAQCVRSVERLCGDAQALGVDPSRIVVAGSSAGAQLAAMVALARRERRPALRGLVLLSGVYELAPLVATSINDALGLDDARAKALSPLRQPLAGCPPALVTWGAIETDAFKAQSQVFADALRAAGTGCEDFETPARNHFDLVFDLLEPGTRLGRGTRAMLASG